MAHVLRRGSTTPRRFWVFSCHASAGEYPVALAAAPFIAVNDLTPVKAGLRGPERSDDVLPAVIHQEGQPPRKVPWHTFMEET